MYNIDQIKILVKENSLNDYNNGIILYKFIIDNYLDNFHLDVKSKIYSNLSAFYLKKEDYVNALATALTSITFDNNNAKAWGRVGWSFKKLKKYNYSLKSFKIAYKMASKKLYLEEIIFLEKKLEENITIDNVFKILMPKILNNDKMISKIKDSALNFKLSNNNVLNLIDEIMDEL